MSFIKTKILFGNFQDQQNWAFSGGANNTDVTSLKCYRRLGERALRGDLVKRAAGKELVENHRDTK